MANTSAVYARIDMELKENAEGILSQLGISPSSANPDVLQPVVLKREFPLNCACPPQNLPQSAV